MKSYVIHLERAKRREAQVAHLLKHAPNAEVVQACDGARLSREDLGAIYSAKPLFAPKYPFKLSAGEVGCFISHRAAWTCIVESGEPAGLVLEDDVAIDQTQFEQSLALAEAHIHEIGYIQFQVREISGDHKPLARLDGTELVKPTVVPVRCSAQLISKATAQRLLELSEKIDRPVDSFIQMRWETGVDVACCVPSGVRDMTVETGGSTLQKRRGLRGELAATIPRLRYKSRIKALSRASFQ